MQILFETSDEGLYDGLGIFKGNVQLIQNDLCPIVPNIGWDYLKLLPISTPFFELDEQKSYYFSHSYACPNIDEKTTLATYPFTNEYASVKLSGRIIGVQFHPEKSGNNGAMFLQKVVLYASQSISVTSNRK